MDRIDDFSRSRLRICDLERFFLFLLCEGLRLILYWIFYPFCCALLPLAVSEHPCGLYIAWPNQPTQVAKQLHIHKNTLLYHMNKIKKITNCDFENGDDFFACNLSLCSSVYLFWFGYRSFSLTIASCAFSLPNINEQILIPHTINTTAKKMPY